MASVEHRAAHEDRASCLTRAALAPTLTPLDERVMATLEVSGQRFRRVAARVRADERRRQVVRLATDDEIRGILRGLEHLGHATGRGGWWRAL